jgi:hypothetical protein
MAKISFWQILGLVGTLSEEISVAMADDGKIDAKEILSIGQAVATKLDFPIEEDDKKKMDLILAIVDEISNIVKDDKVTVRELITLGEIVCARLGINLDKEGFEI